MRLLLSIAAVFVAAACGSAGLFAQDRAARKPARLELWDLNLGTAADALPDEFADYACGTNGGPPSVPLANWREFRRCRPEPSGLREVYFRYDDELEYWAKANNFTTEIARFSGTKVYDFPVVLSGLFDEGGILVGLRMASDPRDTTRPRDEAYALRNFLAARFGRDGWQCTELLPADGEEPVGRTFIKQDCRKTVDGPANALLQTRYFRKKGQSQYDPHSQKETEGQFESAARFELTMAR